MNVNKSHLVVWNNQFICSSVYIGSFIPLLYNVKVIIRRREREMNVLQPSSQCYVDEWICSHYKHQVGVVWKIKFNIKTISSIQDHYDTVCCCQLNRHNLRQLKINNSYCTVSNLQASVHKVCVCTFTSLIDQLQLKYHNTLHDTLIKGALC